MKTLFVLLFFMFTSTALAAVRPFYQDPKFPNAQVIWKQSIGTPAAASTTNVISGSAGATSAAVVVISSGLTNPDVPRNLVITPGGTTADVGTCTITVSGTNIFGRAITEDFAFANNTSSATTGSKAFKTVSSLSFAASCEDGGFAATWSVGAGEKIGLNRCMDFAGFLVFSTAAGAYETTRPTVVADADEVEKNTADFNGTMNGSNAFYSFFLENFACKP